ncbi:MAG: RluA family pseudouridine synthase [Alphaproteobacteria bacterium]
MADAAPAMPDMIHIPLPPALQGQRLDRALAAALHDQGYSRTRLQQLIAQGMVTIDGAPATDAATPLHGTTATIIIPAASAAHPAAQAIPLTIIYEDDDLLIIDKPPGLVVHPGAGNRDHTLVNALLAHCGTSLSGIGGVARPGIVHRLDKDTSGLLVVAKHDRAHNLLATQFADRSLSRTYQAFVWDLPRPARGSIEAAIGRDPRHRQRMAITPTGKPALTHYTTAETYGTRATLLTCTLATGRTHQIRVHLASLGHSVIGDPLYGRPRRGDDPLAQLLRRFPRQALHAAALKLRHPSTGKSMEFKAILPPDLSLLRRELCAFSGRKS